MIHTWLQITALLVIKTQPQDGDLVGHLTVLFLDRSLPDLNDLMTLTHHNPHHGAQRILRVLFERTVTLKYIAENPCEAERLIGYDPFDQEHVIKAIETNIGIGLEEPSRTNLANAAAKVRKEYKQEICPVCKKLKPLSWSSVNSKDMADRVDLGHLYLHAFLIPFEAHPSDILGT